MNLFFMIIFFFSIKASFAHNKPLGRWTYCLESHPQLEVEHQIDFTDRGKVMDFILMGTKMGGLPCEGRIDFGVARSWAISYKNKSIILTLLESHVVVYEQFLTKIFSRYRYCNRNNWKVNEIVHCKESPPFGIETDGLTETFSWKLLTNGTLSLKNHNGIKYIYKKYVPDRKGR